MQNDCYIKIKVSYEMMQSSRLIILEACIAAGKSTLGYSIAKYYNNKGIKCKYLPEFSYPPFLDYYLENMEVQGYNFQIHMIRERFILFNKAVRKLKSGKYKVVIIDRGLLGDLCFAMMLYNSGYITLREYRIYAGMATKDHTKKIPAGVSVNVVYLKSSPEVLRQRVVRRGVVKEIENYDIEYLTDVCNAHDVICSGDVGNLDEITRSVIDFHGRYLKVKTLDYNPDLSEHIKDECLSNDTIEKILSQIYENEEVPT